MASEESERFADPYDESADLNDRARAYLHVNCAHCHQFNAGGAATIELSRNVDLETMKALGVRPSQGTFGISDAQIIAPGDPLGSILFYRVAKLGGGRMPRLGSREVDERAVGMLHDWISQLPTNVDSPISHASELAAQTAAINSIQNGESKELRAAAIEGLTSSTRGALALLRSIDRGSLNSEARAEVVAQTKDHTASEVRDLFERFVPASERVQRLGMVVNQSEILSLESNAERGKQIFFNSAAAACKELPPDPGARGNRGTRSDRDRQKVPS